MAVFDVVGGLYRWGQPGHLEHWHCERAQRRANRTRSFAAPATADEGRYKVARAWHECRGVFSIDGQVKIARYDLAKGVGLGVFAGLAVGECT